jgi:hypothetical protein
VKDDPFCDPGLAYATLGEVAGTLKEAFGKHRDYVVV